MESLGVAGARLATPGHYYCWVVDFETGEPLGLVNETWLARRRTATTAAIAARWLAHPQSKVAALFGTGQIGDEIYATLSHVFNLDEFRVVARRFENAESYAKRNATTKGSPIRPVDSPQEAIDGADIVITMTTADEPFIESGWLKQGALLCSMGGVPEVHFDVLAEADRLVIDDLSYALDQGDLHEWIKGGHITEAQIVERIDADIGEIAIGAKPGRQHEDERILAMIQGMAVGDLAMAKLVLDKAVAAGLGETVSL
jgi:ornithine cyclodeaminase